MHYLTFLVFLEKLGNVKISGLIFITKTYKCIDTNMPSPIIWLVWQLETLAYNTCGKKEFKKI